MLRKDFRVESGELKVENLIIRVTIGNSISLLLSVNNEFTSKFSTQFSILNSQFSILNSHVFLH